MNQPWEHPDWYDLHDTTWTAGPEREPEHYRELLLSLPPLDRDNHLIDVGAGTGKLSALVARGYPRLGRVTLIEPNRPKLERAEVRLRELLPNARLEALPEALGGGLPLPRDSATVAVAGSVLMPIMELRGGTLADGLAWLRAGLVEVLAMLQPGASFFDVETLAPPWARGGLSDPVRRLFLPELTEEFSQTGFSAIECTYRFRDRIILRAHRPTASIH
jgi:SAM-dependent methyltransferase